MFYFLQICQIKIRSSNLLLNVAKQQKVALDLPETSLYIEAQLFENSICLINACKNSPIMKTPVAAYFELYC